jgi:hypothetical protein
LIGRYLKERRAFKVMALGADPAVLTALGNDYGYENVFARQVEGLAETGGILLALSTSGNSPNVVKACVKAKALAMYTIALTGAGGGKAPALAQTLRGRSRVARTLIEWLSDDSRHPAIVMRRVEVNGGPGALFFDDRDRLIGVTALEIAGGEVKAIGSIANPDKLKHLGPVGNLGTVLRQRWRASP